MPTAIDGRRARGDRSRNAVLSVATQLASTDGLTGVSIARLAQETSSSKSGVAALFGSKENLQLAIVDEAKRIFIDVVVEPARTEPAGSDRLYALVRAWIDYSSGRTFRGGCFFLAASAEFAARPGPVRDAIAAAMDLWRSYLQHQTERAIADGALPGLDDAEQLVFELEALLAHANAESTLRGSGDPYRRAERAIADRLRGLGADERSADRVRASSA